MVYSNLFKSQFAHFAANATLDWGYIGESDILLENFIDTHPNSRHIVLVEVSFRIFDTISALELMKSPQVYLVALGLSLPIDQIAFLQKSNIKGFVSKQNITQKDCEFIVNQIAQKGYVPNQFISESQWKNKPKHSYPRLMPHLNEREIEILTLLCHGKTGVEIAQIVHTSEANIRKICQKLREIIGVRSNTEIVIVCISNGWIVVNQSFMR